MGSSCCTSSARQNAANDLPDRRGNKPRIQQIVSPIPFGQGQPGAPPEVIARSMADSWCASNPGWEYTGRFETKRGIDYFFVRQTNQSHRSNRDISELNSSQSAANHNSQNTQFSSKLDELILSPQDSDRRSFTDEMMQRITAGQEVNGTMQTHDNALLGCDESRDYANSNTMIVQP